MLASSSTSHLTGSEVDNGNVKILAHLGSGAYGSVYTALDAIEVKPVLRAVKCLSISGFSDLDRIETEIILHKLVSDHPNIVTLYRTFGDAYNHFMVLDYAPEGDMFTGITQEKIFHGNNELLRAGFLQILDAVEHCHAYGIFHRDLKPENVLCFERGKRLVLTDFGLAANVLASKDYGLGSQQYMSPECIGPGKGKDGSAYMHRSSDIWSLGIMLINMSTALNPWQIASSHDECFTSYCRYPGWLKMMLPISAQASKVMRRILDVNPSTRISLRKLKKEIARLDSFFAEEPLSEDRKGSTVSEPPKSVHIALPAARQGPSSANPRDSIPALCNALQQVAFGQEDDVFLRPPSLEYHNTNGSSRWASDGIVTPGESVGAPPDTDGMYFSPALKSAGIAKDAQIHARRSGHKKLERSELW